MKGHIRTIWGVLLLFLFLFLSLTLTECGKGGTETGTTEEVPINTLSYGARIENVTSVLVPEVSADSSSDISLKQANVSLEKAIDYRSSDDWNVYISGSDITVLTNVFGPADEPGAPASRIRYLMSNYRSIIDSVFTEDPNFECNHGSLLAEGDMIEIAFYGRISNGTAGNRYFNCVAMAGDGADIQYTILYGRDNSYVFRMVLMGDVTVENTTSNENSGDLMWNRQVMYSTYVESEMDDNIWGSLDIRYNQAVIYNGNDGQFGTDDDLTHKARSRITGDAVVNDADEASQGSGDFTVIKYDASLDILGVETQTTVNKYIGRGAYGDGDYSILNINSSEFPAEAGDYCLLSAADQLPAYADPANCVSYEDTVLWSARTFPFTLDPEIDELFEDKNFFEANDTDLIANDGSNFSIPTYLTSP